ncbi:MAG: helix-turn-helix transcriptional regulator [Clostridia bacterium]|nr:helix-turn-helix transcriptional regulator [Clostridia bacterium]
MSYTILTLSGKRRVTLCGTNVYPLPEAHPDRIMPEHDLLYIYSGEQPVTQDDESFSLQTGDLLVLRAGSHHYGSGNCSVNMRSIFIHMNVLPGDRKADDLSPEEISASMDTSTVVLPTVIHCGQNNKSTQIINEIIDVYWSHRPGKERRLNLLVNLLLDELAAQGMENETSREEWTVAVISLFKKHPEKMYSLEELASSVNMNVRTMCARFREIIGKSIHQYQMDYKLEAAYRDLRTGEKKIKDVALSYGFCDPYYFSRQFKNKFGISPKQIKQREPSVNINRMPVV